MNTRLTYFSSIIFPLNFSPIHILPLSANICLSFRVGSLVSSYHVLFQRFRNLMLSNKNQPFGSPSWPSSLAPPLCLCHALLFCYICFHRHCFFCFWKNGNPFLSFTGARSALFDLGDIFQMLVHSQGRLTNTFAFSNINPFNVTNHKTTHIKTQAKHQP